MSLPRFFEPSPLQLGSVVLSPNAVRHVAQALRMKAGDSLELFNGQGGAWQGHITDINKRAVTVELTEFNPTNNDSHLKIHLAQAVSKGNRMDFVMQKATELGVHTITPVVTDRCDVKLDQSRWDKKVTSWQGQVQSACEQCGLNIPPTLAPVITLNQWLQQPQPFTTCLMLHPHTQQTTSLASLLEEHDNIGLIIGPEGGFSESEVDLMISHEIQPLSLGPRILRTETAPLAAIALLQYLSGNLS